MTFIPGLRLCQSFYEEVVKNLIEDEFPGLDYSAGLIGPGSEVLGFDTERSTDHHWGPRLLLFLRQEDIDKKQLLHEYLRRNLPPTFRGYSTHFGEPDAIGVRLLTEAEPKKPINHQIEIFTIASFFESYLSINPYDDLSVSEWLTISEQKLRSIRSGKVFYDRIGLEDIRKKLHYYPNDIRLYLMASEWMKISQEEHFIGRTGEVGDELGSKLIAARLVQSIIRLCFLMEKEYTPYSKWFGTAFSLLPCAKKVSPILNRILSAEGWMEREKHLSLAYKIVAGKHNDLGITKPLPTEVSQFYGRPYFVIHGGLFAQELKRGTKDPVIKKFSADIGSVNQISDTVDLLENNTLLKRLAVLYRT